MDVECSPNHLISVVRSSRGIFFAAQCRLHPDRERLCVQKLQTLLTSRRAPPFSLVTKSHQVSCSACATATVPRHGKSAQHSKHRRTLETRKRQSRRKPLRETASSKSQHPQTPAHSLGFCSRARVFARASKKAFLGAAQVRRAVQHPAAGRGAAATTSSNEKERHR